MLDILDDKVKTYLIDNNMINDFLSYPQDDLVRILTKNVLDLECLLVLDYAIRNFDLSVMSLDYSGWFVQWIEFDYDNFSNALSNRIAAEEKTKLKGSISSGNKHKNNERL